MNYLDPAMEAKHRRRAQIKSQRIKEMGLGLLRAEIYFLIVAKRFNAGTRPPEPQLSFEEAKALISEEFEKMYGITIWDYCQNQEKSINLYLGT